MLLHQFRARSSLKCFVSLLCIFHCFAAFGQTPYLQHFTVEDGLPSSNVYTAYEDSAGVMWFGTEYGITRFDGYEFEAFNMSNVNAATDIWGFAEDSEGRLWFSSQRQLTYLENGVFKAISFPEDDKLTTIQSQFTDNKGNHYIRFNESLVLHQVDVENRKLVPFEAIPIRNKGHFLIFLQEDKQGVKWFFYSSTKSVKLIAYKNSRIVNEVELKLKNMNPIGIRNVIPESRTTYLFPTNDDFVKVDIAKGKLSFVPNKLKGKYEINSSRRTTKGFTLLELKKKENERKQKQIIIDKNLNVQTNLLFLNRFVVNEVFEDKAENIWICTDDGLYFLPKKGRKSQVIGENKAYLDEEVTTLDVDKKGRVWFTNKDLDIKVLQKNGKVHTIHFNLMNPTGAVTYFDDLKFDRQGNLYVGSNKALFIIIPKEDVESLLQKTALNISMEKVFNGNVTVEIDKKIQVLRLSPVKSLTTEENNAFLVTSNITVSVEVATDKIIISQLTNARAYAVKYWKDKLWIGRKKQLFTLDILNKGTVAAPVNRFPYPISALETCNNDKLWIATDGNGLFRYDGEKTDSIEEFFDSRIKIKSLHVDSNNHLWIATNKGISKVEITSNEPFEYEYRMITKVYGLISQEVNTVYKVKDKVYAATSKGLNIFDEKVLEKDTTKVPLLFTNFWVNNQKYDLHYPIKLSYHENDVRIDYLCLSYSNMGDIEYEYMMIGVDKDWQQTTTTFKEYPTLQPGTYTFKIRAKNLDGLITEVATLKFEIKLPWWRTWVAMLAFSLVVLGVAYYIVNYRLEQEKERNEKKRLEELTQLKSRFYSNITHEFRTPLTLIMGLTRQLKQEANQSKKGVFDIIERHSYRLLNLINQLLDLNKLESKAMPLYYQKGDIIAFCKYVVGLFESAAKNRKIHLTFYTEVDDLTMDFDADKVQSILFNLLSNALKFTDAEGQVIVHVNHQVSDNQCIIKVQDTGVGINEDALAYVFNRYYQDETRPQKGNNNTGIGLALVKELVEQMNGKIEVESNSKGTLFTIKLPTIQEESDSSTIIKTENVEDIVDAYFPIEKIQLTNPQINEAVEKPLLLLVEDDMDLMQYLESIIGQYYTIEVAKDGEVGIHKAIEKVPDLIISDVMMPKKDGFELCETLKNDQRTSHIPIILLTAKSNKEDELKGLKAGADVYMVKPFYQEELFVRINQLLENRRLLQQRYQAADLPELKPIPEIQKEDEFVLKVREVIEENIDKYDLDVDFICEKLHISRSQLHNKLTSLTGLSTRKFIRLVRLQKAEKFLRETDLNITEIAYETGFDVKYLSKVFKETYGLSPSKYRKSLE